MTRHIEIPVAHEKTLAEARADFTAEGSPPPGVVGTAAPALPDAAAEPAGGRTPSKRPVLHLPVAGRRAVGART